MSREPMPPQTPDEEALIAFAQQGDRIAQEKLWEANRRWVAAIILAHRPRRIDLEDLMQEVAVKFLTKLDTLRDAGAFRPWLRQIAINACRGAARRLKPSVGLSSGAAPEEGEVSLPAEGGLQTDAEVEHRDAADHLLAQVMTLPSEYREPLLLRCMNELSYQQIGALLDLPVTTIETRLARARRMLRTELAEDAMTDGMR